MYSYYGTEYLGEWHMPIGWRVSNGNIEKTINAFSFAIDQ